MADSAAAPDVEAAEHVDGDTDGSAAGIEEDKVRQSGHGQRALGAEEDKYGNGQMAQAPVQADALITLHASPGLA